jgi:hypothetical protein
LHVFIYLSGETEEMMSTHYTCRLQRTIEEPWTTMEPIYLGAIPLGHGTPDIYCLVERDGHPVMRLDVYGASSPSAEACVWKRWLVIGFANAVHLVALDTYQSYSYSLDWYFGHFYLTEDFLLVTSATAVLCIDKDARLQWTTDGLGIDGVIIRGIEQNIIQGEGEWDPPGGWKPFTLLLHSGHKA